MSHLLNLTARKHDSSVLSRWIAGRDGAAKRAGVEASGQQGFGGNSTRTNLSYQELINALGIASASSAGVSVTEETAMRVATVYACVDLIAGAISTIPLGIYERIGVDRSPVEHDYHWMLNERAYEDMSSADAWVFLMTGKFFHGDGFGEWIRPSPYSSRVIGWKPWHPLRVQPFRDPRTREKFFRVQPETGPAYVLQQADMFQITSLGYDGLVSPSPITYAAREAIGTAIAGQSLSGKLFSEGAAFDYALKTSSKLDSAQVDVLKEQLVGRSRGSRAPLILTAGLEPAQLTMNPKDAEILSTRLFSVEEICRIFRVPPFMVGHTEKVSSWGTGLESQGANFVRYTLLPHLVKIAQEINNKLWPNRARYFVEHNTAALQRGDMKSRFEAYRIGLGRAGEQAFLGVEEVRRAENLPPREMAPPPAAAPVPQPATDDSTETQTSTGASHAQ